jgi:CRP-like cAMP-binding protein
VLQYVDNAAWNGLFAGPSTWPPDAVLLRQGEIPATVYAVDDGAVKLVHIGPDGEESILNLQRAPALIGGAFVIADRPSNVEVRTITACVLRWCSAHAFVSGAIGEDSRASETHRLHCSEIVDLLDRVAAMSLKSSSARLERFLSRQGGMAHAELGRLGVRQSVLAAFLNVTPEHLSRLLKKRMAKVESLHGLSIGAKLDRDRRRG